LALATATVLLGGQLGGGHRDGVGADRRHCHQKAPPRIT
jgi:hypothetical protein